MVSRVLAVVVAILMIPSVVAWWFEHDFVNSSNYLEIVTPLASDPDMQEELGNEISAEVRADVDIAALMNGAAEDLPPRSAATMRALADPMEMAVDTFLRSTSEKLIGSPEFANMWTDLNRAAHYNLLTTEGDTIYIELGPIVEAMREDLSASGSALADRLPTINERYALLHSPLLAQALRHRQIIRALMYALPILALILFIVAVWLSRERFEIVLFTFMGTAIAMVVLLAVTYVARDIVAPDTPSVVYNAFAASLRTDIRWVLLISALAALVTWVLKRRITDRPEEEEAA